MSQRILLPAVRLQAHKGWLAAWLATHNTVTPAVQQRIDAIGKLHLELEATSGVLTEAELDLFLLAEAHMQVLALIPQVELGRKFAQGRKVGTEGPIKEAVRKIMKGKPSMSTAAVWTALALRPPKGWQAMENTLGKYLEGPTASDSMAYRRFENVCSEIRKEQIA